MERKYCTAVVLAAGKSSRMGGSTTKQYMEIGGRPLVAYALEVFETSPMVDGAILMMDAGHMEYVRTEIVEVCGLKKVSTIGTGGGERYESVWKALCTLVDREGGEKESVVRNGQDGYVFLHDRAHPFVTGEVIEQAYRVVCECNVCMVDMPIKDTTKLVNREGMIESSPDRSMVQQARTPQAFPVPLIVKASTHQTKEDCTGITGDTMVVGAQMGVKARVATGSYAGIGIMTPEDLLVAEMLGNSIVQVRIPSLGDIG